MCLQKLSLAAISLIGAQSLAYDVKLAWDYSSTDVTFRLYRSDNGQAFQSVGETSNLVISDANLDDGISYTYQVTAYNAYGESDPSNQVTYVAMPKVGQLDFVRSGIHIQARAGNVYAIEVSEDLFEWARLPAVVLPSDSFLMPLPVEVLQLPKAFFRLVRISGSFVPVKAGLR